MRVLIFILTIVLSVGVITCIKESDLPIIEGDQTYWNYEVLPGRPERLTCLEDSKHVNQQADRVYFDWFYEDEPLNSSQADGRWLDNDTRTLVIENVRKASEGRYRCVCMEKETRKPCMRTRYRRKKSKKTGKKGKKRKVGRIQLEQRIALFIQMPDKVGYCEWKNLVVRGSRNKYDTQCRCEGGLEQVCGNRMGIQRQDRRTKKWADVEIGRYVYGGMTFIPSSNSMEITGFGVNLTFEESGFYRCISYKHHNILCQSDEVPIEPDFPPVASIIPEVNDHLLWIGGPLLAIFTFVLSFICGRILYYNFTSRIVVKAKNSSLIPKYTPDDSESVDPQESDSPSLPHAKSSSSIHTDASTAV